MELSLILKLRFMTESHLCGWIRKHCELIVAVSYRDPAKFENVKSTGKGKLRYGAHLPAGADRKRYYYFERRRCVHCGM